MLKKPISPIFYSLRVYKSVERLIYNALGTLNLISYFYDMNPLKLFHNKLVAVVLDCCKNVKHVLRYGWWNSFVTLVDRFITLWF